MKITIEVWRNSFYPYRIGSNIAIDDSDPDDLPKILKELKNIIESLTKMKEVKTNATVE